jgi:hypothetical protein
MKALTYKQLVDAMLELLFANGVDIEWAEYSAYYDDSQGNRLPWVIDKNTTIEDIMFLIENAAENDGMYSTRLSELMVERDIDHKVYNYPRGWWAIRFMWNDVVMVITRETCIGDIEMDWLK